MNWHLIGSIAWGFTFPLALLALGGLFVYLGVAFNLSRSAAALGFGLCFGLLILASVIFGLIAMRS